MAIVRVSQRTDDDCLPCCIAMVLDLPYEVVMSWFQGIEHNDPENMKKVLQARGYEVAEFETVGEAGAARRIVGMLNPNGEGHALVVDEEHYVVDPRFNPPTKKTLLDYSMTGFKSAKVYVICKKSSEP